MSTSFLDLSPPAAPKLTDNQARATDIMKSAQADTAAFFNNWRGDVLRFMDGGMLEGKFDAPTLQKFLDDWQAMTPGAPAFFVTHAKIAAAFFEQIQPGSTTAVLVNVPILTANPDGSVTVSQ